MHEADEPNAVVDFLRLVGELILEMPVPEMLSDAVQFFDQPNWRLDERFRNSNRISLLSEPHAEEH
ncbi:hypothetical protein, partial [Bradyrhizobium sp.]|uniref:hypothetical protein n=1 Tax=Bradyrhizobium sp. TaxID=376 RepID=UPI003C63B18A